MRMKTAVKAGGLSSNHSQALVVKTRLKAGAITNNHNRA